MFGYFLICNFRGVLGMVAGMAVGLGLLWLCDALHLPLPQSVSGAVGSNVICFLPAVFALYTDRCDLPGVFRSYRDNIVQFYYEISDQEVPEKYTVHPDRELAVFILPLVLWPPTLLFATTAIWIAEAFGERQVVSHGAFAIFWSITLVFCLLTWAVAHATQDYRRL